MRLDKPTGIHLLFLPCSWSIAMASYSHAIPIQTTLWTLGLFSVGSIVMRGAGCTINDLWDQKIDQKVSRTQDRPIAAGLISNRNAIVFLGAQLSLGLGVLTQLNTYSILLGAASLPFVVLYPLMKRITFWPQAFLGITFNWGSFLGWAAMIGSCDWYVLLPLYLSAIQWTLFYDTIYALQDLKDDKIAGVKSTAQRFESHIHAWLSAFALGTVTCLGIAGYQNDQTLIYYTGILMAGIHFMWQISQIRLSNVQNASILFSSNVKTGWIIFASIVMDEVIKRRKEQTQNEERFQ